MHSNQLIGEQPPRLCPGPSSVSPGVPHSRPPRTLVCVQALKAWQVQRLQKASAKGRRNISIKELCGDLQLDRADVLQWLKDHSQVNEHPVSSSSTPHGTKGTEEDAFTWRRDQQDRTTQPASSSNYSQKKQRSKDDKEPLRLRTASPNPRSAPWAQSYLDKKLPRAAELTLEKVFDEWPHPPSNVIDSLWDLHQIPRRRAIQWFARRRMAEEQERQ